MEEKRQISIQEINQFASKMNLQYFETSSKLNVNVQESVEFVVSELIFFHFYPHLKEKNFFLDFYPHLKNFFRYPSEWKITNHPQFPSPFKNSIFCFLVSLKRIEKKFGFKVPKVIRIEIVKWSVPNYNIEEIYQTTKKLETRTKVDFCITI